MHFVVPCNPHCNPWGLAIHSRHFTAGSELRCRNGVQQHVVYCGCIVFISSNFLFFLKFFLLLYGCNTQETLSLPPMWITVIASAIILLGWLLKLKVVQFGDFAISRFGTWCILASLWVLVVLKMLEEKKRCYNWDKRFQLVKSLFTNYCEMPQNDIASMKKNFNP